jgi:hypothetical protein
MIMTPREEIVSCMMDDPIFDAHKKSNNQFTYLPVQNSGNKLVGLLDLSDTKPSTDLVKTHMVKMDEQLIIGADASIYDFILEVRDSPIKLVVSKSEIVGLIVSSDLQALAVRVSLFSIITNLEILMSNRITKSFSNDKWMTFLTKGRREKLQAEINKSIASDGFVSKIIFTQLSDKTEIIRKAKLVEGAHDKLKKIFKNIVTLRDKISHAADFATTPESVKELCSTVHDILRLKENLR